MMPSGGRLSLGREERVTGRTLVQTLFKGGASRSMSYYPIRAVYCFVDEKAPTRILVSVPKRCFKRAVKRNRVKRQVREAYRLQKHILDEKVAAMTDKSLVIAFVWLDDKLRDSNEVHDRMGRILTRISEKI